MTALLLNEESAFGVHWTSSLPFVVKRNPLCCLRDCDVFDFWRIFMSGLYLRRLFFKNAEHAHEDSLENKISC